MDNKKYQQRLEEAMTMLSKKKNTIFLGQTVEYPGSPMYGSLKNVRKSKKIEMPVIENTQMGMSIGMALEGYIPISIFPRIDFLICAIDQLVNHLDKCEEMSDSKFMPGVIIRTQLGSKAPMYPGCQHCGNYIEGLKKMLKNIEVIKINDDTEVIPMYKLALRRAGHGKSTLLVEIPTGAFGGKK